MAQNGNLWNSTQKHDKDVQESGLSRFALRMTDSSVGAFQVTVDSHMLKHIQQCTNVEARKVLGNEA